jgi:hypothetical protein
MKNSDSTNSLTALNPDIVAVEIEPVCFICLDELNEKKEPLVDSSMLRTCGCQFKVHPECWNLWMKDKTDYDCPICRKKSLFLGKPAVPPMPQNPFNQENRYKLYAKFFMGFITIIASGFLIYEICTSK